MSGNHRGDYYGFYLKPDVAEHRLIAEQIEKMRKAEIRDKSNMIVVLLYEAITARLAAQKAAQEAAELTRSEQERDSSVTDG